MVNTFVALSQYFFLLSRMDDTLVIPFAVWVAGVGGVDDVELDLM